MLYSTLFKLKKNYPTQWVYSFLIMIGMLLWSGCGSPEKPNTLGNLQAKASGALSDIVVVIESEYWNSGLQYELKQALSPNVKGVFKEEREFDLIQIYPKGFTDVFKTKRHIFEVEINARAKKQGVFESPKGTAINQKYLKLIAQDELNALKLIQQQSTTILNQFKQHRIQSLIQQLNTFKHLVHSALVEEILDIRMLVPKDYTLVGNTNNFIHFSKQGSMECETGVHKDCYYQMGFFVHKFPYTDSLVFNLNHLLSLRDSLCEAHIFGPDRKEKTYMEYEKTYPPFTDIIDFKGHYARSTKAWWNMVNAVMGGPFINYLILDEASQSVILFDGYVFAPNFKKRDFIQQLDAIAHTLEF